MKGRCTSELFQSLQWQRKIYGMKICTEYRYFSLHMQNSDNNEKSLRRLQTTSTVVINHSSILTDFLMRISLSFLPATPLSWTHNLEGLYELTQRSPQPHLDIAFRTTEIQGHLQACRTRHGGPRTPSRTTNANLDFVFVNHTFF